MHKCKYIYIYIYFFFYLLVFIGIYLVELWSLRSACRWISVRDEWKRWLPGPRLWSCACASEHSALGGRWWHRLWGRKHARDTVALKLIDTVSVVVWMNIWFRAEKKIKSNILAWPQLRPTTWWKISRQGFSAEISLHITHIYKLCWLSQCISWKSA